MSKSRRGKGKNLRDLRRREPRRSRYEKVLIVCEGSKTEPHYFLEVRNYYALNTANVEVTGDCGSDPVSVVKFAKQRFEEEHGAGDPFDKVYAVIDKDAHPNYSQALNEVSTAIPSETFFAISSVPCFEYWLLLHFKFTTAPFAAKGKKSAGQQVLAELKKEFPDYAKGCRNVFNLLLDQLDDAKARAARAKEVASRNQTDNPSTLVHELVDFLQKLKSRDKPKPLS